MAQKKSVVVLGKTGMLGSMVHQYLKGINSLEVAGTARQASKGNEVFDVIEFPEDPEKFAFLKKYDYVINCIGIIKPYCKDNDMEGVYNAIQVNALFPHKLSRFLKDTGTNIIQIATDCVYSGAAGKYVETAMHDALDVYGKTKSLGEVQAQNFLNIRCSIIGPELKNKLSLLEWFLSQPDGSVLSGYANHLWNGVTTLQFAQICEKIMTGSVFDKLIKESFIHHFVPNSTVSKYELLKIFKANYKKNVNINESNAPVAVDRTLAKQFKIMSGLYKPRSMQAAIKELRIFTDKTK